jgi:hypothetical protein
MGNERIAELLKGWSKRLTGSIRPGLSGEIKQRIPDGLSAHRIGTINIIVDLRASRVAVAAAILIGLTLIGGILGSRGGVVQIFRDSTRFVKYAFIGEDAYKGQAVSNLTSVREGLVSQGREAIYYGYPANPKDKRAILMQWKIDDGNYRVIRADLSAETVSASTLIRIQARMLQEQHK